MAESQWRKRVKGGEGSVRGHALVSAQIPLTGNKSNLCALRVVNATPGRQDAGQDMPTGSSFMLNDVDTNSARRRQQRQRQQQQLW